MRKLAQQIFLNQFSVFIIFGFTSSLMCMKEMICLICVCCDCTDVRALLRLPGWYVHKSVKRSDDSLFLFIVNQGYPKRGPQAKSHPRNNSLWPNRGNPWIWHKNPHCSDSLLNMQNILPLLIWFVVNRPNEYCIHEYIGVHIYHNPISWFLYYI